MMEFGLYVRNESLQPFLGRIVEDSPHLEPVATMVIAWTTFMERQPIGNAKFITVIFVIGARIRILEQVKEE